MSILVKNDILNKLGSMDNAVLELGCGPTKRNDDWVGVDSRDFECVDLVGDIFDVLEKIPTDSIDKIYSYHFFEHIENLDALLDHVSRVVKSGGELEVTVPHFSNPYYYSDHTHKSFFGLYTFSYYSDDNIFKRKVPNYSGETKFLLENIDLCFKSTRPFYFRYAFKKLIGYIFNSCTYMKEFYEEAFSFIFPCYEIKYKLKIK